MLKIYRVPQNLRDTATFPGGVQLCKKIPARSDFIVMITEDVMQMHDVFACFGIENDTVQLTQLMLLRFFRDDVTHTVNSCTLRYIYNGKPREALICRQGDLFKLYEYIQQKVM